MNEKKDIRWEQRFSNYRKALGQLQKFIDKGELSELEAQGLVKAFEYTFSAIADQTGRPCALIRRHRCLIRYDNEIRIKTGNH